MNKKDLNSNFTMFFFSDSHNMYRRIALTKADYYVCTGDFSNQGSEKELIMFNTFAKEVLEQKMCKKFFLVPGNHDRMVDNDLSVAKALLSNLNLLIDETINLNGLKVHGSPWSPTYGDWAFMKSEVELGNYWNMIPKDTNILLTHCPAVGILDRIETYPFNIGSKTLLQKLSGLPELKLHVFGHIHEGYGTYSKNGVLHINAALPVTSPSFAIMNPVNPAYLVEIDPNLKKIVKCEQIF